MAAASSTGEAGPASVTYSGTDRCFYQANSKEAEMFEIIMLSAFLYAATCQFFPERPITTRA